MLPGTVGTVLGWAARDCPLLGAGESHPPAPTQPPWEGDREQRGAGGVFCKWPGTVKCC